MLETTVTELLAAAAGAATVVFEEDFDDEAIGVPSAAPGAFTVNSGSVDVIGEDGAGATSFDFFPGNGPCVDLNGTPAPGEIGPAGIETASLGLTAGRSYTLTFDHAFNLGSGNDEVLGFEVGDFAGSIDPDDEPAEFQT